MKFSLMWANHDASTLWDLPISDQGDRTVWLGSVDRPEFERICLRLLDRYFAHPCYYRIDGTPLFQIYDLDALTGGLGGIAPARAALDWFRRQAENRGLGRLHLQCILRSHRCTNITGVLGDNFGTQQQVVEALGFDSLTHYQFAHIADIDRDYSEIMDDVVREWQAITQAYHIPYFPHVSVGWDNNPRFQKLRPGIVRNNTPEAFAQALRKARAFLLDQPTPAPLITVNSWNEWTETSCLQPDERYGYGYLEAVRKVFLEQG